MLRRGGAKNSESVEFAITDLTRDEGWEEAAEGCDFVLHVASPFPRTIPKREDELILPAREGALRVLRASRNRGVRRVVITSSFAAIGYGHASTPVPFTEESWTNLDDPRVLPYPRSKTIAERAAWDFVRREGGDLELAAVNPVGVFGPVLGADYSSSIEIVLRLMNGALPGCPKVSFGVVDVRDVADLHIRAMTDPAARGERFLAVAGPSLRLVDMAEILKARLGDRARRVPTGLLPDWLLRAAALFDKAVAQVIPELGKPREASHEKATRLLGWRPRESAESIVATAESLIALGLIRD